MRDLSGWHIEKKEIRLADFLAEQIAQRIQLKFSRDKNSEDNFHISVREKAERNMANNRILEIFRNMHRGKPVKIVSGHHSPSKIISVEEE